MKYPTQAIMAVDPGGSTGLAWGLAPRNQRNMLEALKYTSHMGSTTITGKNPQQIREIAEIWRQFLKESVKIGGLDPSDVHLVIESFAIRRNSPVGELPLAADQIAWGIIGYRMGAADEHERCNMGPTNHLRWVFQSPAQAKGYATDKRLKSWGLWIPGRQHERSARQHWCYRLAKVSGW